LFSAEFIVAANAASASASVAAAAAAAECMQHAAAHLSYANRQQNGL